MPTPHILSTLQDGIVLMSSIKMQHQAQAVARTLQHRGVPLEFALVEHVLFNNQETFVESPVNVRAKTVLLFQDFCGDPDKDFMRMSVTCDALWNANVRSIILITPFLPYTRQDRRSYKKRESVAIKMIANFMETNAAIDHLVTYDLHAPQITLAFNRIRVDNVPGHALFAPYIRQKFAGVLNDATVIDNTGDYGNLGGTSVVSTDVGGAKRARDFSITCGIKNEVAVIEKERDTGGSRAIKLVGDVGRIALIYDDMGDTMGSMINAYNMIKDRDGVEEVYAIVTHGILSPDEKSTAETKLKKSGLRLIMADTIPRQSEYLKKYPNITVVPSTDFMSEIITALISVNGSMTKAVHKWEQLSLAA